MSSVAESSSLMKPVVVRVKRKLSQASLDAFWLEINERPLKRALLDFEKLSVSESTESTENGCLKTKKVLVQHVETVSSSEATKDVLRSLMVYSSNMDFKKKIEERRHIFKQENQKQDQLRSLNRQKHEEFVKSARFEQIWKSRNRIKEKVHDHFIHEFCHLYDVVRVDEETSNSLQENKNVCVDEDDTILCNYLGLLRECLPDAAAEIEDMHAYSSDQARYVYDLYTVGDDMDVTDENDSAMYPLVQVENEDDYYDGLDESEYETDDSNAEDNPRNDYPDEESSEESRSRSSNSESEESSEDEDFIYGAKGSEDEGFIYEAESSEDDDSTYEELDEDREEIEDYRMLAQC